MFFRWTHLCSPHESQPANERWARPKVIFSTQRGISTSMQSTMDASKDIVSNTVDITGKVNFKVTCIDLPFWPKKEISKNAKTPLDVLILKRKWDLIPKLLSAFPIYRRVMRSSYHAARLSDARVIKLLHKAENFNKETFTTLLHIALINAPKDDRGKDKVVRCVQFLLKMGASPNYIPSKENFDMQFLSPLEMNLFPFMPLEIAAITENEKLVNLLLENEASASICFAIHLAALKGNLEIVKKLIPQWREGRWRPYIKGFKEDATELVRVCTLESGVVQAVCASDNISFELLDCLKDGEKGVFSCKKILTHHMVSQIRPAICSLEKPSLLNKFLYKYVEDTKGLNNVCQELYLTHLISGTGKHYMPQTDVDNFASHLISNGCYLGEIRVSKKSTIHVVCETFVVALKRKMWKTLESLLTKGGNTLWKCLLVSHHPCHKFTFHDWIDDSQIPCLSKGMLKAIHDMPLRLLEIFFEIGRRAMSKPVIKIIKEKIHLQKDQQNSTETNVPQENSAPKEENILFDIMLHLVKKMPPSTKGSLLILSKITSLFPEIFIITLESLRYSSNRYYWFTCSLFNPLKQLLDAKLRTPYVIKNLRQESMEIRLWNFIANFPVKDVTTIQEQGFSLLHIACLYNDVRIVSGCLTVVLPLSPNIADHSGLTPMDLAASRANLKVMNTLKVYGGIGSSAVLVAACVGKGFIRK